MLNFYDIVLAIALGTIIGGLVNKSIDHIMFRRSIKVIHAIYEEGENKNE